MLEEVLDTTRSIQKRLQVQRDFGPIVWRKAPQYRIYKNLRGAHTVNYLAGVNPLPEVNFSGFEMDPYIEIWGGDASPEEQTVVEKPQGSPPADDDKLNDQVTV
jgi:hypothetical protein